jgi:Zinc-binding dehydrogenase
MRQGIRPPGSSLCFGARQHVKIDRRIDGTFTFETALEAHTAVESGKTAGKVVVEIDGHP